MLWIPQMSPGQDKQKTRGPFGKGLHAILAQYLDTMRDPSWVVQGDPDVKALGNPLHQPQGSLLSSYA